MYEIVGAKGNIQDIDDFLKQVKEFSEKNGIIIQLFDADLIFGEKHIISAFKHAKRSINQKTNTTNSLEMELMLYAAGERQLKLAIPKMGINEGKSNLAIVFIGKDGKLNQIVQSFFEHFKLKRDDKVLEGDENTLKKFGLTDEEIGTVAKAKYQDLILEKVALVDIIK